MRTATTNWGWFLILAAVIGVMLRLMHGGDIEYKTDERFMFDEVQTVGHGAPFPWIGMSSGAEIRNPGMSIWIFLAIAKLTGVTTPVGLARGVQALNLLALFALGFFAFRLAKKEERETWCWAFALACVNPLAILLHRKIWAQSTLPFFCVLFWWGWRNRERVWGAALWGLVGACLGQIHMSGFFMAAAVFVWTAAFGRRLKERKPIVWPAWIGGSLLGLAPLIPWFRYLLLDRAPTVSRVPHAWGMARLYFWRFWVTDPLGLDLSYSTQRQSFLRFLAEPQAAGHKTWAVALLHVGLVVIGVALAWFAVRALPWGRERWKAWIIGASSETRFALSALAIGLGAAISVTGVPVFRHYLLVTFPFEWVWLARQAARLPGGEPARRRVLGGLWACQALIALAFSHFVHVNHGVVPGDYGVAYQYQQKA